MKYTEFKWGPCHEIQIYPLMLFGVTNALNNLICIWQENDINYSKYHTSNKPPESIHLSLHSIIIYSLTFTFRKKFVLSKLKSIKETLQISSIHQAAIVICVRFHISLFVAQPLIFSLPSIIISLAYIIDLSDIFHHNTFVLREMKRFFSLKANIISNETEHLYENVDGILKEREFNIEGKIYSL